MFSASGREKFVEVDTLSLSGFDNYIRTTWK